jgi:hypothetical protein
VSDGLRSVKGTRAARLYIAPEFSKTVSMSVTEGEARAREAQCWTHAALATLRERGADSGLAAFLDEVEQRLVPLCGARSPQQG